ncbi:MAG: fibronectin type III domain-containing protein, partial [Elusimicrobia bacterium]|nr:fibronectin type III domain-containing protein [Elusimicrobiota bacterium]
GNPAGTTFEVQQSTDGVSYVADSSTTLTTATVAGLGPATTYYLRVRAYNNDSVATAFAAGVSTRTDLVLPAAPPKPAAVALSSGDVRWTWAPAAYADSYRVYVASNPAVLLGTSATGYLTVSGYSPDDVSGVAVSGVNQLGEGPLSPAATAYSLAMTPASVALSSVTSVYAALSWSANGNPAAALYELQESSAGGAYFAYSTYSVTVATVIGLSPSTAYSFQLAGLNGDGAASAFSAPVSTTTPASGGIPPPAQPAAPAGTTLSTGDVSWTWASVTNADGYRVLLATSITTVLADVQGTALTLSGYGPNSLSAISLEAYDAAGPSPVSNYGQAYTYANAPKTLAVTSVSSASIGLSWDGNGNPSGTTFEVQLATDGVTFVDYDTTTAPSYTARNLSLQTTYTFQVRAFNNDVVPTAFTNSTAAETVAVLPGTPGKPATTFVSTNDVVWSWTAASDASAYEVRLASDTSQLLATVTTTAYSASGIGPNGVSAIVVRGTDTVGMGPFSPSATAFALVNPATGLQVDHITSIYAALSWGANGNPASAIYAVLEATDGLHFSAYSTYTVLAATITGLSPSSPYQFAIQALNNDAVGASLSNTVSTTTDASGGTPPPSAPSAPTGTALSSSDVSWSWPAASFATSYDVYLASAPTTLLASTPTTTVVFSGFDPDTVSSIVVTGVNSTGEGPASPARSAYSLALTPGAPSVTSVSSVSASLSWGAGGNGGGVSYRVDESTDDVSYAAASTFGSTSGTVWGLSNSSTYYFKVRSLNGDGAPSAATSSTWTVTLPPPPAAAGTPSALVLSTGDIRWSWSTPQGATSYELVLASDSAKVLASTTGTSAVLRGYDPDTPSAVAVIASNATGPGPLSPAATKYTDAAAPGIQVDTYTSIYIAVSWTSGGNPAQTVYTLSNNSVVYSTYQVTRATIAYLTPSTNYTVSVYATNEDGAVTASSSAAVMTAATGGIPPAGACGVPAGTAQSTGDVSWTWTAASDATSYRVYLASSPSSLAGTSATNAIVLTGYTPNSPSGVFVQATNATGDGPLSAKATAYSAAAVPASLTVAGVSTGSVSLTWGAGGNPGGTEYELQMSTDGGGSYFTESTTTALAFGATGLSTTTAYFFKVRGVNVDVSSGAFTAPVSTTTDGLPPGASGTPSPTVLSTGDVSWSWSAAQDATGYQVYLASKTSELVSTSASASILLRGYDPNSASAVVVRGVNVWGAGPLSAAATRYTDAMVPTPSVTAVSSASASVAWNANGDPPGTTYTLKTSTDGVLFTAYSTYTAVSATVPGLAASSSYYFQVSATNGDGVQSAFSTAVSTLTGPPAPGASGTPAPVVLSTGDVSWSWSAAAFATSYEVRLASDTAVLLASTPSAAVVLRGYDPNSVSSIVVQGVNAVGSGALSAPATAYTLAMVPTPSVASVSSAAVSVSWSPNGDPAGTAYTLQTSTDGVLFTSYSTYTAASATVPGLAASSSYYFQVSATNGDGVQTAFSAPVSTLTAPPYPGPPGLPAAVVLSTGDVSWSWAAAADASSYEVRLASDPATLLASTPSAAVVLRGYGPNGASGVVVRGVNALGSGPLSAPATAYTFAATPVGPSLDAVYASSVALSWTAGGNPAGTEYELRGSTDGTTYVRVATTTAMTLTAIGLSSKTAYDFRVRAVNFDLVVGTDSPVASTTTLGLPPGLPGAPAATFISSADVSWSWTAAVDAVSYQVLLASDPVQVLASPASSSVTLHGFDPNTVSSIVVRGIDAAGAGQPSPAGVAYSSAQTPGALTLTSVGAASAGLAWTANGNPSGTEYELQSSSGANPFVTVATTTALSLTAPGLSSGTAYGFKVRAVNFAGAPSSFTAVASTTTPGLVPGQPGAPAATVLSTGDVSWTWGAAVDAASYQVLLASDTAQVLASPSGTSVVLRGFDPASPSAVVVRGVNDSGT